MPKSMTSILSAGAFALALLSGTAAANAATAVFAGGCFWSVEKTFDTVRGVTGTVSGFSGGRVANPSYRQVVGGGTGHVEAVEVTYDPSVVSYEQLLDVFFRSIDPTDPSGQFCDKGEQYRAVVFVGNTAEQVQAVAEKAAVERELNAAVTTRIAPAAPFYPAEAEHQNFHVTNAAHYERYRVGCRRDERLAQVWGSRAYRTASAG